MSFTPIFSFGSAGGESVDYDQIVPIVPVTGDTALDPVSGRLAVYCCFIHSEYSSKFIYKAPCKNDPVLW